MSRNLMGRDVPEEMHRIATGIVARGGRVFIANPEGRGSGNCDNCDGWGHFILQHITGGPFASPPKSSGKGGSATVIDGDWYLVSNEQFNCPDCLGTGRAVQRAQTRTEPIHF